MDDRCFDRLAASLVTHLARRRLLWTFVGLGSTALLALAPAAAAPCRGLGERCGRDEVCCTKRCRGPEGAKTCRCPRGTTQVNDFTCQANEDGTCVDVANTCTAVNFACDAEDIACSCFRDVNGTPRCGNAFFCPDECCRKCDSNRDCVRKTGIKGAFCVKNRGTCVCANGSPTFCLPPCGKG